MSGDRLRPQALADEFFLTAHDPVGAPLLPGRVLGIGLASALLGELLLAGHLGLSGGVLAVLDERVPRDSLARSVIERLRAEPYHRQVRDWIAFLATSGRQAVGGRLAGAGLVRRRELRRRWRRPVVRWEPAGAAVAAEPGSRIHDALLVRSAVIGEQDVVFAGLVVATGLDQRVLWSLHADQRVFLRRRLDRLPGPLGELVATCETAVGEAVLSHRT